ncbi:sigma-70 family RNA polymerase sigma factor [Anaerofilum sp. BX8]|uniref:Sigma-70 family RNA polymerase sigma factor n=1 Tax=Anaerofilum hominis TaxID=2763016 RepID=A0A923L1K4_9FIRM|nr:sigma-70 family RNA polymerase sigma factor [Anaerofilum hominis]MBC5581573.1 sigma-70 family RNA polymerase sigma factor [Anaerofilum hominis]
MPLKQCSRDEFIENNLGLVHACANRFRGRGIEYDDLYSAGCMGLVKAYDAFDEERGVQFSTYAVPVILGEIKKLFRDGGSVKVSRSLKELSLKINAARDTLQKKTGTQPTVGELAAYLQVSPEQVAEAISAAMPVLSLTPVQDEDSPSQFDIPVNSDEEKIAETLALRETLRRLDERDRLLIRCRFYEGKTQSETAKRLGTTQVQISRRERKLLAMLRGLLTD